MISPHLFHHTQRYAEIGRLRAYYESTQYKGRPDFWTGRTAKGDVVPLRERAPCVVYPLPKIAVDRVSMFTFGESRFPTIKVEETEDAQDVGVPLSEEEASALETGISAMVECCGLRSVALRIMRRGLSQRTVAIAMSIKAGTVACEELSAHECEPTFEGDDPQAAVTRIVWCYQFDRTVEEDGTIRCKRYWFRRDYDQQNIINYVPVPVEPGKTPEWVVDPATSKPHGFSFCPVLWIRNCPAMRSDIDGVSLYDGLLNEFDALNFALSQRHRGLTYFGTPQAWEVGVEPGDGPGASVRTSSRGFSPDDSGEQPLGAVAGDTGAARKLSPDGIWSYEGTQVRLGLLETSGASFEVATKHVDDIRSRLSEAMQVILAGPNDAISAGQGGLNAKLLAMLYQPMLAMIDTLRDECWWPFGLRAIISMALRMIFELDGEGVYIPGVAKMLPVLARFSVQTEDGPMWMLPHLKPVWGDNFSPSNREIAEAVTAAATAKDKGLITPITATRFVASYFAVDDIDDETEQVEERRTQAAEESLNQAGAIKQAAPAAQEEAEPPEGTE